MPLDALHEDCTTIHLHIHMARTCLTICSHYCVVPLEHLPSSFVLLPSSFFLYDEYHLRQNKHRLDYWCCWTTGRVMHGGHHGQVKAALHVQPHNCFNCLLIMASAGTTPSPSPTSFHILQTRDAEYGRAGAHIQW